MKVIDKVVFDAKVSNRRLLLIPINTIVATPYNPKSRTKESTALGKLTESIARFGLILPIVITEDRDLVDGNRRLAAAKLAGMTEIECVVIPPDMDKDEVFCDVNTTAQKIGGKGWLEACRYGYKKAPRDVSEMYEELFKLVGTYGIDLMIERKVGLNVLLLCKHAKSYGVPIKLDKLILKVVDGRLTNKINAVIRSDETTEQKRETIEKLVAA